jgi:hypothetical protein
MSGSRGQVRAPRSQPGRRTVPTGHPVTTPAAEVLVRHQGVPQLTYDLDRARPAAPGRRPISAAADCLGSVAHPVSPATIRSARNRETTSPDRAFSSGIRSADRPITATSPTSQSTRSPGSSMAANGPVRQLRNCEHRRHVRRVDTGLGGVLPVVQSDPKYLRRAGASVSRSCGTAGRCTRRGPRTPRPGRSVASPRHWRESPKSGDGRSP